MAGVAVGLSLALALACSWLVAKYGVSVRHGVGGLSSALGLLAAGSSAYLTRRNRPEKYYGSYGGGETERFARDTRFPATLALAPGALQMLGLILVTSKVRQQDEAVCIKAGYTSRPPRHLSRRSGRSCSPVSAAR